MKKLFFIVIFTFILLTGCSSSNLKSLSFNELKDKIEKKESFIIYFTGEDNSLEKKLDNIINQYKLNAYKINSNKISEEDKLAFQSTITFEEPSIVFIIDGQDPSKLAHVTNVDTSKNQIIQRLKDMKFIKE